MDREKLRAIFIRECEKNFIHLEQALHAVKKEPADPAALKTIFYVMHSLQGTAAMMHLEKMRELARKLEDAMASFQDEKSILGEGWTNLLLECLDALRQLLREVQEGKDLNIDIQPLLNKLKAMMEC